MRVAINIDIMIKMIINLNCSSVRVRSIYKIKNKRARFRRQEQRLYKWEMRCAFV